MADFEPASNPLSQFWSPGSFHYVLPMARAELLQRVRDNTRSYARLRGRDRFGMISWVQEDRVRVWHATFWRSQPSRGALLLDARVEEDAVGRGSTFSGRLRLNSAYVATVAWTAVYITFAVFIHFPLLFIGVLVLVTLLQLGVIAVSARRDARPMIDFIEKVLDVPAQESPGPVVG